MQYAIKLQVTLMSRAARTQERPPRKGLGPRGGRGERRTRTRDGMGDMEAVGVEGGITKIVGGFTYGCHAEGSSSSEFKGLRCSMYMTVKRAGAPCTRAWSCF